MIEKNFNVPFVAQLAQREKQIQQSYRPIIGVHKWFARRPGALFRALLLVNGRGFGVRREDMRKLLEATRGKVFTLETLDHLVNCTDLKHYANADTTGDASSPSSGGL